MMRALRRNLTVLFALLAWPAFAQFPAVMQPTIQQGLAAYYKLNEGTGTTTADSSGRGGVGTLTGSGSTPTWGAGKFGQALTFSATNYVSATLPSAGALTGPVSLSVWVYIPTTTSFGIVAHVGGYDGRDGFSLGIGSTTADSAGNNLIGLADLVAWAPTTHAVGTGWHQIGFSETGGAWTFYADGAAVGTASTGSLVAPSSTLFIGNDGPTGGRQWTGGVDELRVYNRLLSATEFAQLYGFVP